MSGPDVSSRQQIRFGLFELALVARELRREGVVVKLQERPFEVLTILVENPGEVITRDEFRQRLRPADTFVDFDASLNTSVNKPRKQPSSPESGLPACASAKSHTPQLSNHPHQRTHLHPERLLDPQRHIPRQSRLAVQQSLAA